MHYDDLTLAAHKRINDLPIFFAFSNKQFDDGLATLVCTKDQLVCIGSGGYMRKSDTGLLDEAVKINEQERAAFYKDDDSLLDALRYELGNHEYCITLDATSTLEALDLDASDERVARLLREAIADYTKNHDY